jgi:hypothetical protein
VAGAVHEHEESASLVVRHRVFTHPYSQASLKSRSAPHGNLAGR